MTLQMKYQEIRLEAEAKAEAKAKAVAEAETKARVETKAEYRIKGIKIIIDTLRQLGSDDTIISDILKNKYSCSEEEIKEYL